MKRNNGSFIVLFRNNKKDQVFLIYRSDSPIWNLPGGGIETGETPEEAAYREAKEETGFKIKITNKLGKYKNIDVKTGGIWNTTHLFEGRVLSGEFVPEFEGCKGDWFKISELPKEIREITRVRINDALVFSGKQFDKEFTPSSTKSLEDKKN